MTSRRVWILIALLAGLALALAGAVWLTRPKAQYQIMHPWPLTTTPALWTAAALRADPSRIACPAATPGAIVTVLKTQGDFFLVAQPGGCQGWITGLALTDPATGGSPWGAP